MNDAANQKSGIARASESNHHKDWAWFARNSGWTLLIAVVAYYVLFRLPFKFPPRQRLMSASYAFGFNNGIAIGGLAVLLGMAALLRIFRRSSAGELPFTFPLDWKDAKVRSSQIALALICLAYAGLTFALYRYNLRYAPSLMWETRHFLYRTWLMDIYGLRAYTDFSSEYGPMLTYTPLWIYRLIKPLGGSYEGAYFLSHFLLNTLGVWCAYYVLSRTRAPRHSRVVALVVIAIAGFAPYMGLNGVLVRYLLPFASLLLGHRVIVGSEKTRSARMWWLTVVLVVGALLLANILVSPEVGVSFAIAWLCYALLSARREFRIVGASLLGVLAVALLCWRLLPTAYFGTLIRFSEGANNLPLLPAAHLVFYLITMFAIVPALLAAGIAKWKPQDLPAASLCGALGTLCLVMAPGALGRCDPPHVLFYGMGTSMFLMIRLSNTSRRVFVAYTLGYVAIFIVLLQLINLRVFYGVSPRQLISPHVFSNLRRSFRSAVGTENPSMASLAKLKKYPHLALPYATFGDPAFAKYVVLRGQLQPEYYMAIVAVYSPDALQRKLSDVAKAEYLLVPQRYIDQRPPEPCHSDLVSLKRWLFYPARLPCRADPLDPLAALKGFISQHYAVVEQIGHWSVLRRKNE